MFSYYKKQYCFILIIYITKHNEKFRFYNIKNYTMSYKNKKSLKVYNKYIRGLALGFPQT